jgi:hypothetical protein
MAIETPNNTAGTLEFSNQVICSFLTSSESINVTDSFIIHGTDGCLTLNDPNTFGGPILVRTRTGEALSVPLTHAFTTNMRGLGAADLAYAIRSGRAARAGSATAVHTLEAALGIIESGESSQIYTMTTTAERAEPLVAGITEYPEMALDLKAGPEYKEDKMGISIQMYTLRDFMKTQSDLDTTLARVAAIGYKTVQISIPPFLEVRDLQALLAAHGLRADSVMAPTAAIPEQLDSICRKASILGTDTVRTDGIGHAYTGRPTVSPLCRRFAGSRPEAARPRPQFMYHNHAIEYTNFRKARACRSCWVKRTPAASGSSRMCTTSRRPAWSRPRPCSRSRDAAPMSTCKATRSSPRGVRSSGAAPHRSGRRRKSQLARHRGSCRQIGVRLYVVEQDFCIGDPFGEITRSYQALLRLGVADD